MRILMIIDGLSGGGAEKTVLTLSKGLVSIGHQVSIFSLREICDYNIPKEIDFQIIKYTCQRPWRKLIESYMYIKLLDKAILTAENNKKFDIIFSHLHKTDRIVARSRILKHNNVWFCIHGMISLAYLQHRNTLSRWFKYLKIYYTYSYRNIVAVSSAVLHDITDTMGITLRHGVVIYNPFDINMIQRQAQDCFEMQGRHYIIHVGRLHEHKRHDRLLRAYALSKIYAPLIIMGSGSPVQIKKLKDIIKQLGIIDRVIFRTFTTNPYPWIRGAKLLVLSSDCEGFGNVLVEAMICQTPIVSTNCPGGPAEILTGTLARGLAEMNDESLAKTLYDIYTNPPKIDCSKILSYSTDIICQQYTKLVYQN